MTTATSSQFTVTATTGTASFLKQDALKQGNWIGTYGADGNNVIGDATHYPSYASVTTSGITPFTWASSPSDTRALQNPPPGSGRIAAAWYNLSNFTVTVSLTGGPHDLELYFLDWDNGGRSEKVQISTTGGTVLDTETVSSFSNGVYLNWIVSGNIVIKITNVSGPNAVLSGLFFDPPATSSSSAKFLKQDTTTHGTWLGSTPPSTQVYGFDGNYVIGDVPQYPSYASVTSSGTTLYTFAGSTTDTRALQNPPPGTGRIAAAWFNTSSFTVTVSLTDSSLHDLELYFLDWDNGGRSEKVQISTTGGTVLDTETVSSFSNGVYLNWKVSGNIVIKITNVSGPNAVLSGIFFDQASASPSIATPVKGSIGAPGIGLATNSNPATVAIGAVDFSTSNAAASPLASGIADPVRGLVYDMALEQVSAGTRRLRRSRRLNSDPGRPSRKVWETHQSPDDRGLRRVAPTL